MVAAVMPRVRNSSAGCGRALVVIVVAVAVAVVVPGALAVIRAWSGCCRGGGASWGRVQGLGWRLNTDVASALVDEAVAIGDEVVDGGARCVAAGEEEHVEQQDCIVVEQVTQSDLAKRQGDVG